MGNHQGLWKKALQRNRVTPACTEDAFQWDTREDCDVRQILDRIGDKWSLLVIALLDSRCCASPS